MTESPAASAERASQFDACKQGCKLPPALRRKAFAALPSPEKGRHPANAGQLGKRAPKENNH